MLIKTHLLYLVRTQKLAILLALGVLVGILGPVLARYLNELISWAFLREGIDLHFGTQVPTIIDGYIQVSAQILEIYTLAILFILGSTLHYESHYRFSETYWATPVNKWKHGLTKALMGFIVIGLGLLMVGMTSAFYLRLLFDGFEWNRLFIILFPLLFYILVIYSFMVLVYSQVHRLSITMASGLLVYFIFSLLANFQLPIFKYFPARLSQIGVKYVIGEASLNEYFILISVSLGVLGVMMGMGLTFWKKHR
jgi:hypothetical protein